MFPFFLIPLIAKASNSFAKSAELESTKTEPVKPVAEPLNCNRNHHWRQVGIASDKMYKTILLMRCKVCSKEQYIRPAEVL